jgi:glycosyltransferase involved in cell wall biosynthesis
MEREFSALMIAKAFPPEAAVGVHRMVGLCKQLVEHRWAVTVVTATPGKGTPLDNDLLAAVPKTVRVVRASTPDLPAIAARMLKRRRSPSSVKNDPPQPESGETSESDEQSRSRLRLLTDWLSWWLHVPDGCTGWFVPAVWAGTRVGIRRRPSVVFSSAPVWTGHVVAAVLARALRVPLVADFRDPWCGSAFRNVPYSAHQRFDSLLERFVVKTARKITCAWDGIRCHLVDHYPQKAADISTVLNGFDPEFLETAAPIHLDSQRRVFLHTGSFYGPRSPLPLLSAAEQLRNNATVSRGMVFALVGQESYGERPLEQLVRNHGVQDLFRIMPRVSHREAVSLLKGADVAMLFGQSGNESLASIPGKAFEYIGANKPVLAIGAGKEVCRVMREGGCRVWEASAEKPAEIAATLIDIMGFLAQNGHDVPQDTRACERFTRARMAADLESVLLSAAREHRSGHKPQGTR